MYWRALSCKVSPKKCTMNSGVHCLRNLGMCVSIFGDVCVHSVIPLESSVIPDLLLCSFHLSTFSATDTRKWYVNCWTKSNIPDWYSWHRKSMKIRQLKYVYGETFACTDFYTYNIDNTKSVHQESNSDI